MSIDNSDPFIQTAQLAKELEVLKTETLAGDEEGEELIALIEQVLEDVEHREDDDIMLIRESAFPDHAMEELVESVSNTGFQDYLHTLIYKDKDNFASLRSRDYSQVDFDGVTYYYQR